MNEKGQIIIYNSENSSIKVEVKLIDNNVWLNQDQIVTLYQSSKSNISEHIKHILEEGELDGDSVVRNFRITATDGKVYNVKHYNLVSYQEALEHARKEYDEFKERLFVAPTENEKIYLSHFDELILIEKKEDK